MPRVILSSPDQKALLRLEPDPEGQWWRLRHAPTADHPGWWASFGARTPVELIAAVLDTLTDPNASHAPATAPLEPLRQAGWNWLPNTRVAPDGFAEVEHFTDHGSNSWFITAALGEDREDQLWQARFDGNTPSHLITAFAEALSDPAPLARDPLRLPPGVRQHSRVSAEQRPLDTVAFALERRITDLAARHTSATTRSPAPRPPHLPKPRRTR
ncbi:DUF317 domain-containing protein [Streptomyces violascens]|uniref:DUF317 domain-containing protein n=1 Tax=Streptomyces violascens TaxID=67381 RepID=UPI00369F61C3